MNVQRLLRLADHLDTVNPEEFSLFNWACGTTACAVGHACSIPEFVRDGLVLRFTDPLGGQSTLGCPVFKNYDGWNAVREFFSITGKISRYFFDPDKYPGDASPKCVASRIREYVAKHSPILKTGEMLEEKPVSVARSEQLVGQ